MSARRHWLIATFTALTLLLAPLALLPQPTSGQGIEETFTVDNLGDDAISGSPDDFCDLSISGDCSLRQAIEKANLSDADNKVITFDVAGVITINNGAGRLPPLASGNITINGSLDFGFPTVAIDANGQAVGIEITSNGNNILGMSIYGASDSGLEPYFGSGIYISGNNNIIQTSFIGVAPNGTVPRANFTGVRIDAGATGNEIGRSVGTGSANYISGNTQNGVLIRNSSGNFVRNNYIGLVRDNFTTTIIPRPNNQYGVQITSVNGQSQNNVIGGTTISARNFIGANVQAGVLLFGSGTTGNFVQSNLIGIDSANTDFGNSGDGLRIENGASSNSIGGVAAAPLVISGNTGYGVLVRANGIAPPASNQINGVTYIGPVLNTPNGSVASLTVAANNAGGIRVEGGATGTAISGTPTNRLIIAGNGGVGVSLAGTNTSGTTISGVLIGLVPDPSASNVSQARGNTAGISVSGTSNTSVTGSVISGNNLYGISLSQANNLTITSNIIGLSRLGNAPLQNGGAGILVGDGSVDTTIGGAAAGDGNIIAANLGDAIAVSGASTRNTTISNNTIGLRRADGATSGPYTTAAANTGDGVNIGGGADSSTVSANTIGGAGSGAGVRLAGSDTLTTTISLNQIGWVPTGAENTPTARPLALGVAISGARVVDVLTNSIRLNSSHGIQATDVFTVTISDNDPIQGNGGAGILVDGASRGVQVLSNTVRANTGLGIQVAGTSQRVTMRYNRLTANAEPGIQLSGTSLYSGSGPDSVPATSPNHNIDPPIDNRASPLRLSIDQNGLVSGYVYTSTAVMDEASLVPLSACPALGGSPCTVQVFRPDPALGASPDSQGFGLMQFRRSAVDPSLIDALTVNSVTGAFGGELGSPTPLPPRLLFQATDGFGNSSAYGVLDVTPDLSLTVADNTQDAAPGQIVTYTLQLENTGTVDFTNLVLEGANTLPDWNISLTSWVGTSASGTGPGPFSLGLPLLRSGETRPLTVSLQLPTGANENVRVPKLDTTVISVTSAALVTETASLQTTVLASPVLNASPQSGEGSGEPGTEVPYAHTITNNGNITVTLNLSIETLDAALSTRIWEDELSTQTLELGPGQAADILATVTVPPGARPTDDNGQPVRAITTITAAPVGYPAATITFSDTTFVDPNALAVLRFDDEQSAAAGSEVSFFHIVENQSNNEARFCLDSQTNKQSQVSFFSATTNFVIDGQGCFTLYTAQNASLGQFVSAQFEVRVRVNERLLPDEIETVNVFLRRDSPNGPTIGNARVVDRVVVTIGQQLPRLWLPAVRR